MNKQALYDISKTYLQNAEEGPFFHGEVPHREYPPRAEWLDFFGHKIASPLGVPAGPLLNSKWIQLAATLGYDVVTYKTIRSHEHPAHPLPNVVPVKTAGFLDPAHLPAFVNTAKSMEDVALDSTGITNSFGNPSRSPAYLQRDIPEANRRLHPGQVMIVSVFGTARGEISAAQDFADTASFTKECGAKIIEANYSCPNVSSGEGSLYASPEAVALVTSKIVRALKDTPLIIKLGVFPSERQLQEVLLAAARSGARGVCGINTISMQVCGPKGEPALGKDRLKCGICGSPIRQAALQFTRTARQIIDREKLDLKLLATGGATQPEHFQQFLDAGADIVMTATGMMWDPFLALRFHESRRQGQHAPYHTH